MEQVIFLSEFMKITKKDKGYYIQTFKSGQNFNVLKEIIAGIPNINITSFTAVRNAIQNAPSEEIKFAEEKERVIVEISPDELKAYITLNVMDFELVGESKTRLIKEILIALRENGVVYGIKQSVILGELKSGVRILIAEGDMPQNGCDAIVTKYQLKEVKPEIKKDGKVDHYELSLINKVQKGDWLGELIFATPGVAGKSVKGKDIPPMPGKAYHWVYDKASVEEVVEEGKSILRSLKNGAVYFDGEKIQVSNHLEVVGDVDFRTGNIDFDGFITIGGSVADNFSINADKDIEIKGEYGVGSVKEIRSRFGNIYIKGGIAGKGKAVIRSRRNIYTKYISDATIYCDGSVHIGFYCFNSTIHAKEVILDSPKGQIIGGNINAEIKVVSSTIGSTAEKRTNILVAGFDRNDLRSKFDELESKLKKLRDDLYKLKQEISIYSTMSRSNLNNKQSNDFNLIKQKYEDLREEMINLEYEKKALAGYLRTRGEGEIAVLKIVYPNTFVEIKKHAKEISQEIYSTVFYYADGEIKQL